jgi:tetratricopeptide (TPR) repeat protein
MSKKRSRDRSKAPAATTATFAPVHAIRPRRLLICLRVTGFLLLAAVALGWWQPAWRVWGVHHLAFLPPPLSVILFVAAALFLTRLGGRLLNWLRPRTLPPLLRKAAVWSVAAMLVFFALRVAIPLLGDGSLWIKELSWIGVFEARGQNVPGTRWLMRKEPLEMGLHEAVFRGVSQLRPRDFPGFTPEQQEAVYKRRSHWLESAARNTYAWLSILAGGLFIYLAGRFAQKRVAAESRAPFLLLLLSGSGMLLFFGYVENYSWMSLASLATMLAGIDESFPPRKFPVKTVVAFLLAVSFHLTAVAMLPGILFMVLLRLWPIREGADAPRQIRMRAGLILGGLAVVGMAEYVIVKGWRGWISVLPLVPAFSKDGYAFFSSKHGLDLLNLLALSAAAAVSVLIGVRQADGRDASARIQNIFLFLASAGGIALLVTFNPNLGLARDWDVVTAALWPLIVWAAWRLATSDLRAVRSDVLAALAGFALAVSVPFALVQSGERSSLARFETLLNLDRSRSAYGWENIATYYEDKGDLANRVRCWKSALAVEDNPRYQVNVAVALRLQGNLEESESYTVAAVKRAPQYYYQLVYLAKEWVDRNRLDKARDLLRLATELDPNDQRAAELLAKMEKEIARRDSVARAGPQN